MVAGQSNNDTFLYTSHMNQSCLSMSRAVGTVGVHFDLLTNTSSSLLSLDDCQQYCTSQRMDCLGFEYSISAQLNGEARCELWNEIPTEFGQPTSINANVSESSCHAKEYIELVDSVCRTASGSAGSEVDPIDDSGEYYLYFENEGVDVKQACHERCVNLTINSVNSTGEICYGFEINPDPTMRRCEVWRVPFTGQDVSSGRSCFVKPHFLSNEPSSPPTQTPQPSSPTEVPTLSVIPDGSFASCGNQADEFKLTFDRTAGDSDSLTFDLPVDGGSSPGDDEDCGDYDSDWRYIWMEVIVKSPDYDEDIFQPLFTMNVECESSVVESRVAVGVLLGEKCNSLECIDSNYVVSSDGKAETTVVEVGGFKAYLGDDPVRTFIVARTNQLEGTLSCSIQHNPQNSYDGP